MLQKSHPRAELAPLQVWFLCLQPFLLVFTPGILYSKPGVPPCDLLVD